MSFVNIPLENVSRCNEKNYGGFFGLELDSFFSCFFVNFFIVFNIEWGWECIYIYFFFNQAICLNSLWSNGFSQNALIIQQQ